MTAWCRSSAIATTTASTSPDAASSRWSVKTRAPPALRASSPARSASRPQIAAIRADGWLPRLGRYIVSAHHPVPTTPTRTMPGMRVPLERCYATYIIPAIPERLAPDWKSAANRDTGRTSANRGASAHAMELTRGASATMPA